MKKNHKEQIRYLKWRYSPTYLSTVKQLKRTQYYSVNYWKEWQFSNLKNMLVHASEHVVFYQDLFKKHNLNPRNLSSLEEFQEYPLLDKKVYQTESHKFISRGINPGKLMKAFTGGTTGEPVPLFRYWNDIYREKAYTNFVYRMLDIDPHCKKVIIRGPANDSTGQYYYRTEFGKVLRLSSLNLSDENLGEYVRQIEKFKPELMFATPSVTVIICKYMEKAGIRPAESLKWAFTPSENLYPSQKDYIERIMKCKVVNSYGQSEHVVSAGRCNHSELYHVLPQYSYAELIGEDGQAVNEEGRTGEIVGTSFTNNCCPLIRYRTQDYAVFTTERCSCGREYKMWKEIKGRQASIALTDTNRPVSLGPELLCTVFNDIYSRIRLFRIEQKKRGELIIYIDPYDASGVPDIEIFFKKTFEEYYPGCFHIHVKRDKDLRLTEAGKNPYFKQHLKI